MPQDSLRAVLDSVFATPDYRWVESPRPWYAFLIRWLEAANRWLLELRDSHPLGFQLFLAALVVILVAILVHVGWVLARTLRSGPGQVVAAPSGAARRDRAWYRREADRLAAEGRYAEAMQADFVGLMLALDAAQVLRFHPGKTPAEHTRESRLGPRARGELEALVGALYGYAFARWPCGRQEFERMRAQAAPERYAAAH